MTDLLLLLVVLRRGAVAHFLFLALISLVAGVVAFTLAIRATGVFGDFDRSALGHLISSQIILTNVSWLMPKRRT